MPLFVIYCLDKPGHAAVRAANREAHLAYSRANVEKMLIGGPLLTDDGTGMIGSMLILDMPDRAAVEEHMNNDPYVKAGLFESVTIRPYRKVLP